MTNDPIIKIEQLEKSFGDLHVLKGIDLEVNRGEVVCIIGASGSGKSTLLRCINLLEEADSGHIWFDGQDLMDLKVNLNALRQKIGMVFQGFNLFNNKSVLDNCTLAPMDVKHIPKAQAEATAIKHLTTVGLADFIHADSRRLSGGQKQRVAIARALAMDPKVMLLDEPTSALDPELVGEVLSVIRDLADGGMTMIMATHQMDFARALATDILFMEQGKIIEQGAPDVLLAPGSGTRTSDFCGKLFDLRGTEKSDEPTVSELLTGDLSHDITDDGSYLSDLGRPESARIGQQRDGRLGLAQGLHPGTRPIG